MARGLNRPLPKPPRARQLNCTSRTSTGAAIIRFSFEPLARVLSGRIPGVKPGVTYKLVKWDGDGPVPDDAADNPRAYPQVTEVLECGDTAAAKVKVLYRRS